MPGWLKNIINNTPREREGKKGKGLDRGSLHTPFKSFGRIEKNPYCRARGNLGWGLGGRLV